MVHYAGDPVSPRPGGVSPQRQHNPMPAQSVASGVCYVPAGSERELSQQSSEATINAVETLMDELKHCDSELFKAHKKNQELYEMYKLEKAANASQMRVVGAYHQLAGCLERLLDAKDNSLRVARDAGFLSSGLEAQKEDMVGRAAGNVRSVLGIVLGELEQISSAIDKLPKSAPVLSPQKLQPNERGKWVRSLLGERFLEGNFTPRTDPNGIMMLKQQMLEQNRELDALSRENQILITKNEALLDAVDNLENLPGHNHLRRMGRQSIAGMASESIPEGIKVSDVNAFMESVNKDKAGALFDISAVVESVRVGGNSRTLTQAMNVVQHLERCGDFAEKYVKAALKEGQEDSARAATTATGTTNKPDPTKKPASHGNTASPTSHPSREEVMTPGSAPRAGSMPLLEPISGELAKKAQKTVVIDEGKGVRAPSPVDKEEPVVKLKPREDPVTMQGTVMMYVGSGEWASRYLTQRGMILQVYMSRSDIGSANTVPRMIMEVGDDVKVLADTHLLAEGTLSIEFVCQRKVYSLCMHNDVKDWLECISEIVRRQRKQKWGRTKILEYGEGAHSPYGLLKESMLLDPKPPTNTSENGSPGTAVMSPGSTATKYAAPADAHKSVFTPPIMVGYLTKQGGRVKTWKRRWFELRSHSLMYYENEKDSGVVEPKGIISFLSPETEPVTVRFSQRGETFFEVKTPNRIYIIEADTYEGCKNWVRTIHEALEKMSVQSVRCNS